MKSLYNDYLRYKNLIYTYKRNGAGNEAARNQAFKVLYSDKEKSKKEVL